MDVRTKIGERIRELRDELKLSQQDLAYQSDLDRSYIASVEKGQRNISIVNIEKIAKAFNVTLHDFFNSAKFNN